MLDLKDKIATKLYEFFNKTGADPIYTATIICFIITLFYVKDFNNWKNTSLPDKGLALSALFGTIILTVISLLKIIGLIKL